MYDDVIREILETIEEDKKDKVIEYTLYNDISRILDKFLERNTWAIKARLREIANRITDEVDLAKDDLERLSDNIEDELEGAFNED